MISGIQQLVYLSLGLPSYSWCMSIAARGVLFLAPCPPSTGRAPPARMVPPLWSRPGCGGSVWAPTTLAQDFARMLANASRGRRRASPDRNCGPKDDRPL